MKRNPVMVVFDNHRVELGKLLHDEMSIYSTPFTDFILGKITLKELKSNAIASEKLFQRRKRIINKMRREMRAMA